MKRRMIIMNITFWVTENCNLACKYCYVNKHAETMQWETALAACELFQNKLSQAAKRKEKIHVSFHGGEPLLNFDVICKIINWMKEHYSQSIFFSLTTNGTVYSEEMFQFLKDNKVELSLSLDGEKRINDKNRVYKNQAGSVFDNTIKTLRHLQENNIPVRIRMTVNRSNVGGLYENYVFLHSLKPLVVSFAFDRGDKWTNEDMEQYYENYCQIMNYLLQKDRREAYCELFNMVQEYFRYRTSCDGGVNGFHISAKGKLYPCMFAVGKEEFVIGNVQDGIDKEALNRFFQLNNTKVRVCGKCSFQNHCGATVCKVINKYYTGDPLIPSAFTCNEHEVLYSIYKKYEFLMGEFDEQKSVNSNY